MRPFIGFRVAAERETFTRDEDEPWRNLLGANQPRSMSSASAGHRYGQLQIDEALLPEDQKVASRRELHRKSCAGIRAPDKALG